VRPSASIGEILVDPEVDGGDDHVDSFLGAQHLDPALGGGDGIDEGEIGEVGGVFPRRDGGRREPEDADAHPGDLADHVGREGGVVSAAAQRVGGEPREAGFAPGLVEHVETEVILVVSEGHARVTQRVHREHHWVDGLVVDAVVVVGERRALDGVAAVDQEQIRRLLAGGADEGGDAGEAVGGRLVVAIVDGEDSPVEIGGGEDGDAGAFGGVGGGAVERQEGEAGDPHGDGEAGKREPHGT